MMSKLYAVFAVVLAGPIATATHADDAVKVDPPINITIRTVRNTRVSGQLVAYDKVGFSYKNVIDLTRTLKWSEVNAQTDYLIHQKVLPKQDAKAWFKLGQRLLQREDGRKFGEEALDRAVRLDPKLREPAKTVKKNPDAEIDLSPQPSKPDGDTKHGDTKGGDTKDGESTGLPPIPKFKGSARPWTMLDETRTRGVVQRLKAIAEAHAQKLDLKLQSTESKHFLIYSDLPITQFSKYGAMLDRADRTLSSLFQLKRDAHVWYGKGVIFLFGKRENYEAFERKIYYARNPKDEVSLHRHGDGSVIVAAHRKADGAAFEDQLVKAAMEGYLYRYVSNLRLAAWVEQGLAGYAAAKVVLRSPTISETRDDAVAALLRKHDKELGGDFFTARTLEPWRQTTAISIVQYMSQRDDEKFAAFVNGLKAGYTWQVCLEQFYEKTEADLLRQWGNSLGVGAVAR